MSKLLGTSVVSPHASSSGYTGGEHAFGVVVMSEADFSSLCHIQWLGEGTM